MRLHIERTVKLALVAFGAALGACASAPGDPAGSSPRSDMSVITQQTIAKNHFQTAYEAVESLRSNWLLTKGTDSFQSPTEVRVYLNNTLLGGVQSLREIGTPTVAFIRHYDGITATARWGIGHGAGVIFVSTRVADNGEPGDRVTTPPPPIKPNN